MKLPYLVVDQNCLRDEIVLNERLIRAREYGELLVIPDTAFIEMTKNAKWELTIEKSLNILAKYPEGIVASYSPGQLLRMERDSGRPHCDVVWHEATPEIQRWLYEIAKGERIFMDSIKPLVSDAQEVFRGQKLNHAQNKIYVTAAVEFWQLLLPPTAIKQLRKQDRKLFCELLAAPYITEICRIGLGASGWETGSTRNLASSPSVSSHNFLCIAALGLRYLVDGGIEGKSAETVSNDVADLDYLLMATFCKDLLTKDRRLKELYLNVCMAIDQREMMNPDP
jgi:hypothetical protein